jgi:hypothetical protein
VEDVDALPALPASAEIGGQPTGAARLLARKNDAVRIERLASKNERVLALPGESVFLGQGFAVGAIVWTLLKPPIVRETALSASILLPSEPREYAWQHPAVHHFPPAGIPCRERLNANQRVNQ